MTDSVGTPPRDRLLMVGTSSTDVQIFIGDKDITTVTQRLELELDARNQRIARVVLTILPRDGFELALPVEGMFAFLPAPGLVWRQERLADGTSVFRCERPQERCGP